MNYIFMQIWFSGVSVSQHLQQDMWRICQDFPHPFKGYYGEDNSIKDWDPDCCVWGQLQVKSYMGEKCFNQTFSEG